MRAHALVVAQTAFKHWTSLGDTAVIAGKLAEELKVRGFDTTTNGSSSGGGDRAATEEFVAKWIRDLPLGSNAIVVWTGHGYNNGSKHYLVCHDTPKERIDSSNAIASSTLASFVGNSRAGSLLLVFDTCHSGKASSDLVQELLSVLSVQAADKQFSFAILASSHGLEKAKESVFLTAFYGALFRPDLSAAKRGWSDNDEYITPDQLKRICAQLIPVGFSHPQYFAGGSIREHVLPNPRFRGALPAQNVEERAWRLPTSDAVVPLSLAARGVEVGEQGWFFTGRFNLQRKLIDWLSGTDFGLHIVTGPAGSGKSAVIGRIVLLSDREYRRELISAGELTDKELVPPIGSVDVAIHGKGKTLEECGLALCRAFRLSTTQADAFHPEEVIEGLRKLERPATTIVFDALDEAAEGHSSAIASYLIVPLSKNPRTRVLVGTRRSLDGSVIPDSEGNHDRLRRTFGQDAVIHDLADEPTSQDDICEYVYRRLKLSPTLEGKSADWLGGAAKRVALQANGVFLYARIVSRTIREQGRLDDVLPTDALSAFEQDLQIRFAGNEVRVDELLGALAWGEGLGLSRHVWPMVASACSRSRIIYNGADITWVLANAGWHIVEAGEDGQAVYRLAHQSLADHYRRRADSQIIQARITNALRSKLIEQEDWLLADRYLWRYLADHAAKAGLLDRLMEDAGFVSIADPLRLAQLLWSNPEDGSDVYLRVASRLVGKNPVERLCLLHLTVRMEISYFEAYWWPQVPVSWQCRWANVTDTPRHRVLGYHGEIVGAVAFAELDGQAVVGSLDCSGTARLWNVRTGLLIGAPFQIEPASQSVIFDTQAIAICLSNGKSVIVALSGGRLNIKDFSTGKWLKKGVEAPKDMSFVAIGTHAQRPVCLVTDNEHARAILVYDALELEPISPAIDLKGEAFRTVAIADLDGRTVVLVTTLDHLRIFDVATGRQIKRFKGSPDNWRFRSIAMGSLQSKKIIGCAGADHSIKLFNSSSGGSIGVPILGHGGRVTSIAMGYVDDRPILVSASEDHTVRLWDLDNWSKTWTRRRSGIHQEPVSSVSAVVVDGRSIIGSVSYDSVWLWHGDTGRELRKLQPALGKRIAEGVEEFWRNLRWRPETVRLSLRARIANGTGAFLTLVSGRPSPLRNTVTIALGEIDHKAVVVEARSDNSLRLIDVKSSREIGPQILGHTSPATSVLLCTETNNPIIASSTSFETFVWDFRSGQPLWRLDNEDFFVSHIAFGRSADRAVLVLSGFDRRVSYHRIELRDGMTGCVICDQVVDDRAETIAVTSSFGRLIVAAGDSEGFIRVLQLNPNKAIVEPFRAHTKHIRSIAFCEINDSTFIVSSGDDGNICRWQFHEDKVKLIDTIPIQDGSGCLASDGMGGVVVGLPRGVLAIRFSAKVTDVRLN